ncbi:MAG: Hsp70 family protein [Bryobacteraceae bacterium]
MSDIIVGIDLGTTNSEVAAFHKGEVRILGPGDKRILPSCVGFSATGELLVGEAARNQQALYPGRTVHSIKRKMGLPDTVTLGDKEFTPPEISAFILSELAEWAAQSLGQRPSKAVITVPSYFSDAQRNATREAGALAGLEVVRILNEPTAASLAYGYADGARHTALVYDLGGGTFDVSVVLIEGEVTEVLASHGNNRLGGDDFDDLLVERLASEFLDVHGISLRNDAAARARLWWAAEEAKKKLSFEPFVKIREEALVIRDGRPLHLEMEIDRREYETMIRSFVESTLDSVSKTLRDAGRKASDMDAILLVGGSTRTPLVTDLLIEHTGLTPRQDVHPDLCVALGAGVLASRLAGQSISRILVDVSPFSFGISYVGERGGYQYPYCYRPIIRRNTPLPLTRTESYFTGHPSQTEAQINVYQGDDDDALKNILVGDFMIEGLTPREEPVEILCRMRLDLDGILEVTAVEKHTGKSKRVTISNALKAKTAEEMAAARKRIQELHLVRGPSEEVEDDWEDGVTIDAEAAPEPEPQPYDDETAQLLARSRGLLEKMHGDDREEAIGLHEQIESALESDDAEALQKAAAALRELLFFVEGKPN